ncbi:MAG: N-acetylmuramoyl-L-alanine amidase [Armatimonadetes bacterium]|nr:N-acetylmuramoyl-L-alanine amidase [Armatimonadota bacterium]
MDIQTLGYWLNTRDRGDAETIAVVLHADAGRFEGTVKTLKMRRLSYHYYIRKDGAVFKFAPAARAAQHCGATYLYGGLKISNSNSIGVCLENLNDGKDPYTDEQRVALKELLGEIVAAVPSIRYLTTHRDISYPRKTDPKGFEGVDRIAALFDLAYWTRPGVPAA